MTRIVQKMSGDEQKKGRKLPETSKRAEDAADCADIVVSKIRPKSFAGDPTSKYYGHPHNDPAQEDKEECTKSIFISLVQNEELYKKHQVSKREQGDGVGE